MSQDLFYTGDIKKRFKTLKIMSNPIAPGKGLLKVSGIVMIILGLAMFALLGVGLTTFFIGQEDKRTSLLMCSVGTAGVLQFIAGIVGVKNCNKLKRATTCFVWGIIAVTSAVTGIISAYMVEQDWSTFESNGSVYVYIIVFPILFLIGAILNRKAAILAARFVKKEGDGINITIRKLTPDLAEDYVRFFDSTPHDDNIDDHKCYCVCWCDEDSSSVDYESKNLSSREKRRDYAIQCVRSGHIQGYLAYCGDEIVGWCNANVKSGCLKCYSWRRFMGDVPVEEPNSGIKVKSIYCFMIAPQMKRKGIATLLLEHVCKDAAQDGFDFVEGYPYKENSYQSSDFGGHVEMYKKAGFTVSCETKQGLVMRKALK